MSQLLSLIYVSAATDIFNDGQLVTILELARKKNKALGITGLLLFNNRGTFLQLIEGEEDSITKLYSSITKDPRHQRIDCLDRQYIAERSFPDWQMGFQHISPSEHSSVPGISAFFQDTSTALAQLNNETAKEIFAHFKCESSRVNKVS